MTRADVETRIWLSCRQVVVKLTVCRIIGVDTIVSIGIGRQITSPVTADAFPIKTIVTIVASRHIFEDNIVCEYLKAIVELELTVQNHAIAIPATHGNIRGFYRDCFMVIAVWTRTRSYRDQVSGFGSIYGRLYRGIHLWDT